MKEGTKSFMAKLLSRKKLLVGGTLGTAGLAVGLNGSQETPPAVSETQDDSYKFAILNDPSMSLGEKVATIKEASRLRKETDIQSMKLKKFL
jgi:hypothetical protein